MTGTHNVLTLSSLKAGTVWGLRHVGRCSCWWGKLRFTVQEISSRCPHLGTPYLLASFSNHEAFMVSDLVCYHCIGTVW